MNEAKKALHRRIAPSVSLTLELSDDSGATLTKEFRLSFDFNAIALVEERAGISMLSGEVWKQISGRVLSIMLWAAVIAQQPEYDCEDGLGVIRSYMDAGNMELVSRKVFEAFIASMPKEKQEEILRARDGEPNPTQPANPPA